MLFDKTQLRELAKPHLLKNDEIFGCEDGNFFSTKSEHFAKIHCTSLGINYFRFDKNTIDVPEVEETENAKTWENAKTIKKTIKKS